MVTTLIICVGNEARGDDGVAHRVARLLTRADGGAELPQGVRLLSGSGLDFAMAEDVAACDLLVVVDAERREAPAVEVRKLSAGTAKHSGHAIDASGLLALAQALYGATPGALLVSVAAPEMSHSDVLSDTARAASEEAALVVRDLCIARG